MTDAISPFKSTFAENFWGCLDYIPGVSLVTNVVHATLKASCQWDPQRSDYGKFLALRSFSECAWKAIPFINIVVSIWLGVQRFQWGLTNYAAANDLQTALNLIDPAQNPGVSPKVLANRFHFLSPQLQKDVDFARQVLTANFDLAPHVESILSQADLVGVVQHHFPTYDKDRLVALSKQRPEIFLYLSDDVLFQAFQNDIIPRDQIGPILGKISHRGLLQRIIESNPIRETNFNIYWSKSSDQYGLLGQYIQPHHVERDPADLLEFERTLIDLEPRFYLCMARFGGSLPDAERALYGERIKEIIKTKLDKIKHHVDLIDRCLKQNCQFFLPLMPESIRNNFRCVLLFSSMGQSAIIGYTVELFRGFLHDGIVKWTRAGIQQALTDTGLFTPEIVLSKAKEVADLFQIPQ